MRPTNNVHDERFPGRRLWQPVSSFVFHPVQAVICSVWKFFPHRWGKFFPTGARQRQQGTAECNRRGDVVVVCDPGRNRRQVRRNPTDSNRLVCRFCRNYSHWRIYFSQGLSTRRSTTSGSNKRKRLTLAISGTANHGGSTISLTRRRLLTRLG